MRFLALIVILISRKNCNDDVKICAANRLDIVMRVLNNVTPTPEQLPIIARNRPGPVLIRGAAGSGKTTTALLRLRSLVAAWLNRKRRLLLQSPVRTLVLTYNRTLRGYIAELAKLQVDAGPDVEIEITTFGRWSKCHFPGMRLLNENERKWRVQMLGRGLPLEPDFLCDEVEYVVGRFLPKKLDDYLDARRDGRGSAPRVDRALRQKLLADVIEPYTVWKLQNGRSDWNDLATRLSEVRIGSGYDIVIADESQDFSANQIRAIMAQLAEEHSVTFILDAAQRIYPRGFTWREAGVTLRPESIFRLGKNHRNTIEIARFAKPLLDGIPLEDDGTLPDFNQCDRHGPLPKVLSGRFSRQVDFALHYLRHSLDITRQSVAFLHARGGGYFDYLKSRLAAEGLEFVEITRQADWPQGEDNIALSTLHSAKGLEFDHVLVLGLNAQVTPHGIEDGDDRLTALRRLLAMGVGRARKSVVLGYKPEEASTLISFLQDNTFETIAV
jgi:superfamily I DNA and RNA helicase